MIKTLEISARQTGKSTRIMRDIVDNNKSKSLVVFPNYSMLKNFSNKFKTNASGYKEPDYFDASRNIIKNFDYSNVYFDEFDHIKFNVFYDIFFILYNHYSSVNIHLYTTPSKFRDLRYIYDSKEDNTDAIKIALQKSNYKYTTHLNPDMFRFKNMMAEDQFLLEAYAEFIK